MAHPSKAFRAQSLSCGLLLLFSSWLALSSVALSQPALPNGFLLRPIGSEWELPVSVDVLPDGRLLVAEKEGLIWLLEDDRKIGVVLDLRDETLANGDRGLLSLAVAPDFAQSSQIFLLTVVDPNEDGSDSEQEAFSRLIRYTLQSDGGAGLVAAPGSRLVLLGDVFSTGIPSCYWSHAIGDLLFLTDGSLVLTAGDGAHYDQPDFGGLDPDCFSTGRFPLEQDIGAYRALSLTSLAGKVLRLDPASGLGYPDNPFYTGDPADLASKIYAMGFRNPFRMALYPGTGPRESLFVADVGLGTWEEINLVHGGESFGWPCHEGPEPLVPYFEDDSSGVCAATAHLLTEPLLTWNHDDPKPIGFTGSSATGVVYYDGTSYPPLYQDTLFFADFADRWIRNVRIDQGVPGLISTFAESLHGPVDLVYDHVQDELLIISFGPQTDIYRLSYVGNDRPPVAIASADPTYGQAPLSVQFDGSASYDPDGTALSFHWDLGDGTTSDLPDPQHVYPDEQAYTATLTVTDEHQRQGQAELLITPGNTPPRITAILAPVDGSYYSDEELITVSALAEDDEDDIQGLPLEAFWHVDLIHDHHVHPDWHIVEGLDGSFTVDSHGPGTYHQIRLVVRDSQGLEDTSTLVLYDTDTVPRVHLVELSDTTLRIGQPLHGIGHLESPGIVEEGSLPTLTWFWGDGTSDVFTDLHHHEDTTPSHVYLQPDTYQVELRMDWESHQDSVFATVSVVQPRSAVAIFLPLVAESAMNWTEQEDLALELNQRLTARGIEAPIFLYNQQDQLSAWMADYLDDGVRDVVVVIDIGPSSLYSGESDGSLAETWLETGNGILWTGGAAFWHYINALGEKSEAGAGRSGADEVLDSRAPFISLGAGFQQPRPGSRRIVPSLVPYFANRALRPSQIGSEWSISRIFAEDVHDGDSDALMIRHQSGGFFSQFYCVEDGNLPRANTLFEFLDALFIRARESGLRDLK